MLFQGQGEPGEAGTMICQDEFYTAQEELGTMIVNNSDLMNSDDGTVLIASDAGTMIENSGTMIENSGTMIENDLGTMVINDDDENDDTDDSTMRSKMQFMRLQSILSDSFHLVFDFLIA